MANKIEQRYDLTAGEIRDMTGWPDPMVDDYLQTVQDLAEIRYVEPWHEVGASGEPAFQNGWANVGGVTDETLAFRKTYFQLEMKGLIDSGTITDGTVVFTLPDLLGYRPANLIKVAGMYVQGSAENAYQLEIQPDGDVAIYGVSGAGPVLSFHIAVRLDN